jgi:putative protease
VDEIKQAAESCPEELSLEVFVHGALCYGVSGRCYWSSYLGGKSGLRGRCVQPCRRVYEQDGERSRLFSCQDLWLDVLAKLLVETPRISALKIEGRKKGPHYVYYTTAAYRLIRDYPDEREMKKTAAELLEYALGRKGTHYHFLPQRPFSPVDVGDTTGSGMLVGKIAGPGKNPYIEPRIALFADDVLRIGYEDEPWHRIYRVRKNVPKKGNLFLSLAEKDRPKNGTLVFLIDRREGELKKEIKALETALEAYPEKEPAKSRFRTDRPQRAIKQFQPFEMTVYRSLPENLPDGGGHVGVWLSNPDAQEHFTDNFRVWYWLPPVIWPNEEAAFHSLIKRAIVKRCRNFVLNAPWQMALFPADTKLRLWAGPFCNTANELAVEMLAAVGFSGVIASPELSRDDYSKLPSKSPLPLGIVITGNWPLCISRTVSSAASLEAPFASPKGELAWIRQYGQNYWVYPNWPIDLNSARDQLKALGYRVFVEIAEPLPETVPEKKRKGLWNWDLGLK